MHVRVIEWIEGAREEVVAFLQDLVRIPSVTGDEGPIQEFIAGRLEPMGLVVDVWEPNWEALKEHPAYVAVSRGYEGRPNVVGTFRGRGAGSPSLSTGTST